MKAEQSGFMNIFIFAIIVSKKIPEHLKNKHANEVKMMEYAKEKYNSEAANGIVNDHNEIWVTASIIKV